MSAIQIALADSHIMLREALKCVLSHKAGLAVVAEVSDGEELTKIPVAPDIILLNSHFKPDGGVSALPIARKHFPNAKVVVMTDGDDISVCRSAYLAGCDGLLISDSGLAELHCAIDTVQEGKKFIPERLRALLDSPVVRPRRADRTPLQSLSRRERQVLICLSRGMSYKQIAEKLQLGVKSIETYRSRLFRKLNFDTKADLMRFAMDNGLMNPTMDIE